MKVIIKVFITYFFFFNFSFNSKKLFTKNLFFDNFLIKKMKLIFLSFKTVIIIKLSQLYISK